MTAQAVDTVHLANNRYNEAVRVSDAFRVQVHKRRAALRAIPEWDQERRAEQQERIDDAVHQLEAAERAESTAWQDFEHARKKWIAGG